MDISLRILKWEKHNPRKDVKRPSWFALDNGLVEDDDFFQFSHAEFKTWIYLLSKASKKQSADVVVSLEAAQRKASISPKDFMSAIEKLQSMGMVTVHVTHTSRARHADVTLQTDRQTEQTNKQETPIGVSSSAVVAQPPPRQPNEPTQFFIPSEPSDLFLSVTPKTIERWAKLYPDREFLNREVVKALNYYANNPKKQPRTIRGWVSAMSSWFERGWRNHQASIKGAGGANRGIADILKDKMDPNQGAFKLVSGGEE